MIALAALVERVTKVTQIAMLAFAVELASFFYVFILATVFLPKLQS